jgi:nucleoside 2-deoxyribosyltransferase
MKIYFAGSIRGGREDKDLYAQIILALQEYGTVLTEHIGNPNLSGDGEVEKTSEFIYERDAAWVREADCVVAEVTTASLGVGYELGLSEALGKPVLCLFREEGPKKLSAMVSGNKSFTVKTYQNLQQAQQILKEFFNEQK